MKGPDRGERPGDCTCLQAGSVQAFQELFNMLRCNVPRIENVSIHEERSVLLHIKRIGEYRIAGDILFNTEKIQKFLQLTVEGESVWC